MEKAAVGGRDKWEPIWGKFHMLRRLCETKEVALPVLFLLSDEASFITATDIPVDVRPLFNFGLSTMVLILKIVLPGRLSCDGPRRSRGKQQFCRQRLNTCTGCIFVMSSYGNATLCVVWF